MRSWGMWVGCALAGALVLGSGANSRSAPVGGEEKSWSAPRGGAHNPRPTGLLGDPDQAADPAAMEAAQAIIDRDEAASGRTFDPAFRADVLKKLASKPLEQLEAIRNRTGGGWGPSFLGSTVQDFVYTPVPPCRIIDTRLAGGPMAAGTPRDFRVASTNYSGQGGSASGCGIPFGPTTAAVINFVAVSPAGAGDLRATPYGTAIPQAAIINYAAVPGLNIANGLVVQICNPAISSCGFDLTIRADVSATQLVADVQGYFAPPFATSLDVVSTYGSYFACASGFDCGAYQTCGAGYTITGGGCQLSLYSFNWYWANNSPAGGLLNTWYCQGTNTDFITQYYRVIAMCSRVPGR